MDQKNQSVSDYLPSDLVRLVDSYNDIHLYIHDLPYTDRRNHIDFVLRAIIDRVTDDLTEVLPAFTERTRRLRPFLRNRIRRAYIIPILRDIFQSSEFLMLYPVIASRRDFEQRVQALLNQLFPIEGRVSTGMRRLPR